MDLIKKIKNFISENSLITEDDKILVGFSGGPDSTFLLYFLKENFNNKIVASHINHKLRGRDSEEDEKFVRNFCQKLKIPIYVFREDVKKISLERKISLEEAGREVRFNYFNKILLREKLTKIALGHNLDDNVETILINIIKGSGVKGIVGISEKRDSVIHPLINIERKEIIEYLNNKKIGYRIDVTNLESDFLRNKIRNHLIPLIEKEYNKNFKNSLLNLSNILKSENEFMEKLIKKLKDKIISIENGYIYIDLKFFKNLHISIKRRIIRECLNYFNLDLREYSLKNIDDTISLMNKKSGKEIELPLNLVALKDRDRIVISRKGEFNIEDFEILIPNLGIYKKVGLQLELFLVKEFKKTEDKFCSFFDYDLVEFPLKIRKPKQGEKFTPLGMDNEKKLKNFFNDIKVPKDIRWNLPVLTDKNGNIIWIIGLRISNKFKVSDLTKRVLCIKIKLEDFRWIKIFKRFL